MGGPVGQWVGSGHITKYRVNLDLIGAIFLDQFGWECSNLNAWIQPILSHMRRHINFL